MKFTLAWLKDHLETDADLDEITEALTRIGLEVESLDNKERFKPFKIAQVVSAEKHPDADKLQVLEVDAGDGKPVQVVCGAPNARKGLIGAFAAPGTYVPGIDLTLSVGKIRGVESHGMMCSERELELSDDHEGIIDLPNDAPIGASFAAYAGLDDPVFEIGITPNRPDALGVRGIARDLEAAGIGKLKRWTTPKINGNGPCPTGVIIESEDLCPAFGLRMVRGVQNGPSPKWMQQRLLAIGLRPISALVDITNYVTFDLGRPLHVFDADSVKGDLRIRRAEQGEKFIGLDEKEYTVGPENCVIADNNGVESLAGIMGGLASGCSLETTNVLVESALWDPMNIARSGRDLGINTDARYRFERGVDPAFMTPGLDHATQLVMDLCGGEPTDAIVAGTVPEPMLTISFDASEVKRLTGTEVSAEKCADILTKLGFDVETNGEEFDVTAPSWRPDVSGKADLVEEIMRIYGVDKINSEPLPAMTAVGGKILTDGQTRTIAARRALASRGMMEAVTWSFVSANEAELFGGGSIETRLANPISIEMSDMRPSLLAGLVAAAGRNTDRGHGDVALFEVGAIYQGDLPADQRRCAGGIRRGTAKLSGSGRDWNQPSAKVDAFDAKADALSVLEACGFDISKVQITTEAPPWYHPGKSGSIQLGPKLTLATFGELHPLTLEALDVTGPICGFEVYLDEIPSPRKKPSRSKGALDLADLQAVHRDFAFIVDRNVSAGDILRAAAAADKNLISSVGIFDLFVGDSIGDGMKSVAIEVILQPKEKTMTDDEIAAISAKIVDNVTSATGGTLRS